MLKTKITTVGSSSGVVLPKDVLARLNAKRGDTLMLVETPNGYEITAYDPEFETQLEAAEEGLRRYRNAMRELADK